MSTRTIIEINHDQLGWLLKSRVELERFLCALGGSEYTAQLNKGLTPAPISGLRVLAQRHHSEPLTLQIGVRRIAPDA